MSAPSTSCLSVITVTSYRRKIWLLYLLLFLRARYRDLVFFFCFYVVSVVAFFLNSYAPINVKPAQGERGRGEAGHGVGI